VVSVAAALEVADGTVRDVRLALGGVAHRPWRATRAERALRGAPATDEHFAAAARLELEQARPLRDNAYKVPLAVNLIVRALRELREAA
jgi:xanthine dehydrogenase YagS FAD-binding subunit